MVTVSHLALQASAARSSRGPFSHPTKAPRTYAEPVIVLNRFRVPEAETDTFVSQGQAAVAVLAARAGFVSADLGRNLDDPTLWTVTTRWQNVGSYRRALQGYEAKMVVVPLLSLAIDEPSAYDDVELVGTNQARSS
jgi:quinol monooxygenase YgiN